jgi:uncharacterized damage-inducible protein DinB
MTENQTVENLLALSSAIEKEMVTFYCRLRQIFSHIPEAEGLWTKLRDDEIDHIFQLDQIKESLSPDQLSAPADNSMIEQAERVIRFIDPERWEEIGDLDEAVDLANEYENSEANRIFLFLAERYIPQANRKKFIEAIINDHLERLISLPAEIDTPAARKKILSKQLQ